MGRTRTLTNKEAHLVDQMRQIKEQGGEAQAVIFSGSLDTALLVRETTERIVDLTGNDEDGDIRALLIKVQPDRERRIVQAGFAHQALDSLLEVPGQHEIVEELEEDRDDPEFE